MSIFNLLTFYNIFKCVIRDVKDQRFALESGDGENQWDKN